MTLSKSSLSMDKRHSISKTFSWLPSPMNHHAKENRRRSGTPTPTISTSPTSTTPSLSSSSSSSPTTKKFGFFSKFRSSVTELDQILSSDEDEEEHQTPPTPRDSHHLMPSTSISSLSPSPSTKMVPPAPLVTMTAAYMHHDIPTSLPDRSSLSPPPKPPKHASLNQHVQNILAFTFDNVDEMIEKEWESDRHRLEIDLLTPAPYQFS
ncbi:unnamed protein product [Absidia cylindrospora]